MPPDSRLNRSLYGFILSKQHHRILILGVFGSVVATWLAQLLPSPVAEGAWWRALPFHPVPAWVLISYTVILIVALVWAMNRWRVADQLRHERERRALEAHFAEAISERDSMRQQLSGVSSVPRITLMRFVAVVLSDNASREPKTHLNVCRSVAGLAGQGVAHAAISDALGTMLHIDAVRSSLLELALAPDWHAKLTRFEAESTKSIETVV